MPSLLESYLASVEEREKKATPAPWHADLGNWQIESRSKSSYRDGICMFNWDCRDKMDGSPNPVDPIYDADFIAHSRTDIHRLLEIIRVYDHNLRLIIARMSNAELNGRWLDDARAAIEKVEELLCQSK
jgi:hypothetical protein